MKRLILVLLPLRLRTALRALLFYYRGEPEVRWLAMLVDRSRASIDVGANNGVYSWWMSRLSLHCYSFEPNPVFEKDINASGQNITVSSVALSNTTGVASLFVPSDPTTGNDLTGLASLRGGGNAAGRTIEVSLAPLDCLELPQIGFIKIDVEGHEIEVLQGARQLIVRDRPNILIEAEERHRTDAIASVVAWFDSMGMVGFYLVGRKNWAPIAQFDRETHQNPNTAGNTAATMNREYLNNFLFVAAERAGDYKFLPVCR